MALFNILQFSLSVVYKLLSICELSEFVCICVRYLYAFAYTCNNIQAVITFV